MKTILLATVFAAMSSAVLAQEAPIPAAAPAEPAVNGIFAAVCNSDFILSPKAQTACDTDAMPKATKKGDRFTATGLGTEFNTLYRQMTPPANNG